MEDAAGWHGVAPKPEEAEKSPGGIGLKEVK
jgi:hypothetical protein